MFFFFFLDDDLPHVEASAAFSGIECQNSANKGEWSELYTLYKLLVDQNLFPISKEQREDERLRLPILSILRYTKENLGAEYRVDKSGTIQINANEKEIIEIQKSDFENYSDILLRAIKNGKGDASFEIPELKDFRIKTCCPNIKCYSRKLENGDKDKSDLYIVIHDAFTGQTPKLGFSIKSELGSAPTLLNATKLTNFVYKLSRNLPEERVNYINSLQVKGHADIQGRVGAIMEAGANLEFHSINPNTKGENIFYENLHLIDSSMPDILAHLLKLSYTKNNRKMSDLTDILSQ